MKDAYYFPHDSNAKDDPKCVLLIEQLGMEGYGIYWMLVETLRDQPDYKYPITLLPALARRYNTTTQKVKTVVSNYGLFQIENELIFFSDSLNRRMVNINERRLKLSEAGKRGNAIRWGSGGDNSAIATQSQEKETKGNKNKPNETKPKKIFKIPTVELVQQYCIERENNINAESFIDYYEARGWILKGGQKMRNWKAAVRTWETNNANKDKPEVRKQKSKSDPIAFLTPEERELDYAKTPEW